MRLRFGSRTWDTERIEPRDWILIIGLCLAPMTGLRIWKIGPAEVLCLLWGIKYLSAGRLSKSGITIFFLSFILALSIGSLVGYYIAPNELRLTDLLTWIYLGLISISIYEGLRTKTLSYNEKLFYLFAKTATIWYLFLYIFSRTISRSFLGAPLWYSSARFSGGGTNPHQIAVLLCGLTFVYLRKIIKKEKVGANSLYLIICLFLMIQTASSTGVMAVALGIAIAMYFLVSDLFPGHRTAALVVLTLIIILILVVGATSFMSLFIRWIEKDPNGLGRFHIFSSFNRTFSKSPLFGLGPGIHGLDGYIEFHNTYIEILAASGLVGGLLFLVYSVRLFKTVLRADWKLVPIVVSMYAYGLAGFAMRRLVYWGLIAFVTVISEQLLFTNNHLDLYSERRNK